MLITNHPSNVTSLISTTVHYLSLLRSEMLSLVSAAGSNRRCDAVKDKLRLRQQRTDHQRSRLRHPTALRHGRWRCAVPLNYNNAFRFYSIPAVCIPCELISRTLLELWANKAAFPWRERERERDLLGKNPFYANNNNLYWNMAVKRLD